MVRLFLDRLVPFLVAHHPRKGGRSRGAETRGGSSNGASGSDGNPHPFPLNKRYMHKEFLSYQTVRNNAIKLAHRIHNEGFFPDVIYVCSAGAPTWAT